MVIRVSEFSVLVVILNVKLMWCVCMCVPSELSFLETSALTGENVEEVFLKCTRTILTKIDAGTCLTHSLSLHNVFVIS